MESVLQKYEFQIITIEKEREQLLKKEIYLPLLRFISFLLVLVLFYKYLIVSDISFVYFSGTSLLTFLFLTWWDSILKRKIERCTRLINICRNEIRSINGDFSPFEIGDEYINSDHSYSYDLDLFGKNSLFNCINRSVTIFGKNRLADYFISAYNYKNLIFERQKAIAELSENVEFRQQLQLVFFGQTSSEKERLEFIEWLNSTHTLLHDRTFNVIRYLLPTITIVLIILASFDYLVVQLPIMMVITQLLIVSMFGRKTMKAQSQITSKVGVVEKYSKFLLLVEKSNFKSQFLVELKNKLSHDGVEVPSTIIKQLSELLNWLDTNLNIIASVPFKGYFMLNLIFFGAVKK